VKLSWPLPREVNHAMAPAAPPRPSPIVADIVQQEAQNLQAETLNIASERLLPPGPPARFKT
jgi:hypothetical protein